MLVTNMKSRQKRGDRSAFTLVELLMVIVIIAVLAGLLIPAINAGIKATKSGALKLEVDELSRAIERYREKYGEYPPDGSDWTTFQRSVRKAFPNILQSELALLDPTVGTSIPNTHVQYNGGGVCIRNAMTDSRLTGNVNDLRVMDSAEALVFFLGGFSSDPARPFTGRGGPFLLPPGGTQYCYNSARENPLFEFQSNRLTLDTSVANPYSTDEIAFFGGTSTPAGGSNGCDLLPVYMSNYQNVEATAPYVYFDSRTYVASKSTGAYWNYYQRQAYGDSYDANATYQFGAAYPLLSDTVNSAKKGLPGLEYPTATNDPSLPFLTYQYMEPTTFQVIGPGLDGLYGGRLIQDSLTSAQAQATLVRFPSGNSLDGNISSFKVIPKTGVTEASLPPGTLVRMQDNVANFSGSRFDAGLP
jgi:prepilin-type N-terminal cleavage/methylation domain-containing protein